MKTDSHSSSFIFGRKPLIEAIELGKRFDKVLIQKDISGEQISQLKSLCAQHSILVQFVPKEKIDRSAGGTFHKPANHQGVLGYFSLVDYYSIDDVIHFAHERKEHPLLLVLDGVTDVHNFGAIARSAECMGVHGIIMPESGSAQINAVAIKASAGALNKILVCKEKNIATAVKVLKANGVKIFAAHMGGATAVDEVDFDIPSAIVLGDEGAGISNQVLRLCDENIAIPMRGKTESLNVSVSAGIILWETSKRRKNSAI